jgi:hypothetical protein
MAHGTVYTRTLRRALEACGGAEQLAGALSVAVSDLTAWMDGAQTPPAQVFLDALDLVSRGSLRRRQIGG